MAGHQLQGRCDVCGKLIEPGQGTWRQLDALRSDGRAGPRATLHRGCATPENMAMLQRQYDAAYPNRAARRV